MLALLVVVGGALRLGVAEATHPVALQGDERSYLRVAFNLARGRGHLHGAMRAHWPPGNAWLLAQFVRPASDDGVRLHPLVRVQVLVGTLLIPFAFLLGRALFDSRVGLLAAAAVAVHPTLIAFSHYFWSESLFALLLTGSLWALLRARDGGRWGFAAAAGVGFGVATLTREIAAPVAASCAIWWVATAPAGRRRSGILRALLVLGLALLVVAPWTARNYALFGRLVPVSTVGWMGMREGNASDPRNWLRADSHDVRAFRKRYYAVGDEMERMDLARREALEHIRAEQPGWLARKLLRNTALLLSPDSLLLSKLEHRAYGLLETGRVRMLLVISVAAYLMILVPGALGVLAAAERGRRSFALCALAPLWIIHVVANANPRYRLPFMPLLTAYAAFAVLNPAALGRVLSGRRGALAVAVLAALAVLGGMHFQRRAVSLWNSEVEIEPPRRIILFSMDTVRADRIGGFGGSDRTPNLQAIAAEGTQFTRFYAASGYTIPSHMSLFTGLDPAAHGVGSSNSTLAPGVPTLAELLRARGYRTQAFHEGVYVAARFGFDRGFDEYRAHGRLQVVRKALPSVLAWLREAGDQPYFLFLHSYAAHFPYGGYLRHRKLNPERQLPTLQEIARLRQLYPNTREGRAAARAAPEDLRAVCTLYNQLAPTHGAQLGCGENRLPQDFPRTPHFASDRSALLASYDARIALVDRAIGRIRDTLVELGQWEDTLLVVTADHGEAFFEHGLYRHGRVPFDEVLRVPLIISLPRLLGRKAVRRVDELAWHLDLAPTLLRLAGGEPPASWTGRDLTPLMLGASGEPRDLFPLLVQPPKLEPQPSRRVVLRDELKYIEGDAAFGDPQGLLFDVEADRRERSNLRASRPADFASLAAAASAWEASQVLREAPQADPAELSEGEQEELRALGYIE